MSKPSDWWRDRKGELMALAREKTPLYVYNEETLNETLFDLLSIEAVDALFYSVNANSHPKVIAKVYEMDVGFTCTTSDEIAHLLEIYPSLSTRRLFFIPDSIDLHAYGYGLKVGASVVVESPLSLKLGAHIFQNREVFLGIHIACDQERDEMGFSRFDAEPVSVLSSKLCLSVVGLHVRSESDFPPFRDHHETITLLQDISRYFGDISVLSIGSGICLSRQAGKDVIDIPATGDMLEEIKESCPQFQLWFDPGRHIISHAGVLLAQVTRIFRKEGIDHVRVNVAEKSLASRALNGASCEIVNISKYNEWTHLITHKIHLDSDPGHTICQIKSTAPSEEGDILLFTNAGAPRFVGELSTPPRKPIPEVYLKARRICQVKI